ncbi:UDP-glucose dehydrogenase family protein [Planococcus salinarum]|uniref:UDP-glucose dehydrogenase family protein n=1 Tax=Planococcus salinarum TaxID=622695 RepID=UPI000E3DF46B|nr:UDP-glucose/GDP-mannose dehydrogenase family protein [Planococcus salinarum]TAA66477.1 UDP-glucose/GDP-mannose dehydrogenase family protein [Planococcus salinarum]
MKIAVIGTGYVGMVTGATLSEIGQEVVCVDIDERKVEKMKQGISPIYEPGLTEMMKKNLEAGRLSFTTSHREALRQVDAVYIAVGTPENADGSANLSYVEQACKDIARNITRDTIIVTKSTVPVGSNYKIRDTILMHLLHDLQIEIVSNPEFLREGSAIYDSFHADRIIIGTDSEKAAAVMENLNAPFNVPIFRTDIKSAEMIKYASNAFLSTKISFINEISNICELLGADVENVAKGMGMDKRIGPQFLKAGIGYGGSCFPKDTKALIQIAGNLDYEFQLLKGVVNVNIKQQSLLIEKLKRCIPDVAGKKIAVLGLAFKPETDDMRESASIIVTEELIKQGARVMGFDPVAMENARSVLHPDVEYAESAAEAIQESDAVLILTEWQEIKKLSPTDFKSMTRPLVIDGRNCYSLQDMKAHDIEYHSVGRPPVNERVTTVLT